MMNLKRIHKTIFASILAATIILPGMAVSASSASNTLTSPSAGTYAQENKDDVAENILQKVITSAKGTIYGSESYTYSFTQEEQFMDNGELANETTVAIADITISGIAQNGSTGVSDGAGGTNTYDENKKQWIRTASVDLDLNRFQMPGIYTYIVKEQSATHPDTENTTSNNWTDSKAEYRLRVYVEDIGYDADAGRINMIKTVTCEMLKDNEGNNKNNEGNGSTGTKVSALQFDSSYTSSAATFAVTKLVTGTEPESAQTNGYTFTVAMNSKTAAFPTTSITCYVIENGKRSDLSYTGVASGTVTNGIQFTLKAGQTAYIEGLTAGAMLKVSEDKAQAKGYDVQTIKTQIYSSIKTGSSASDSGKPDKNAEKSNIKVDEGGSSITFTNDYEEQEMIVTGVVTDIAPYITIVVLAIAGIAAYIIIRRRMR